MTRIKDTMIMEQYHAAVSAMVRVALMFEGDLVGDEGAMIIMMVMMMNFWGFFLFFCVGG